MKPDTKILCRVGGKLRDYKVIEVWQWTEDRLEEKADHYIRADIVETIIEELARLSVDNRYDKSSHSGGLSHTQEIQVERKRILIHYGLDT